MKTQLKNQLHIGLLALFCLLFAASCTKQEDAPDTSAEQIEADFFSDLPDQTNARMVANDVFDSDATFRKRYVTFNRASFQSAIARQSTINLQLFADAAIQVRTTEIKNSDGVEIWKGTVAGDPFSRVCISYIEDNAMGTIHANGKVFRITPLGDGQHVIGEVYQRELPKEACGHEREILGQGTGQFGQDAQTEIASISQQKTSSNVIRVMVVLTGLGSMCSNSWFSDLYRTQCEESLNDVWNPGIYTTGYTASVVIACSSYDPVGEEFDADLNWLKNNASIGLLRDMTSSDLVAMFVSNGSACGLGQRPNNVSASTSGLAFTVTKYSCAFDNYSFPHEIGHNLGMRHDRYVYSNGGNANKCGYGYVYSFQGSGISGRSVMAYSNFCSDQGGDCERQGIFSVNQTLNLGFFSIKLGLGCGRGLQGISGSADNVSQFNTAAPFVAAYR